MKKLLIVPLLILTIWVKGLTAHNAKAQVSIPQVTFNTLNDLRGQAALNNVLVQLNGLTSANDGNGGLYMWNASSTATDDGFLTVAVSGVSPGRWIRVGNGNTLKFSKTFSGGALQTTYTITYGVTLPFVPISVFVQPRSANAAVPSWITNITNSSFDITFSSVPVLGTNNLSIDVIVIKQ
jgi:hypothetical protein